MEKSHACNAFPLKSWETASMNPGHCSLVSLCVNYVIFHHLSGSLPRSRTHPLYRVKTVSWDAVIKDKCYRLKKQNEPKNKKSLLDPLFPSEISDVKASWTKFEKTSYRKYNGVAKKCVTSACLPRKWWRISRTKFVWVTSTYIA